MDIRACFFYLAWWPGALIRSLLFPPSVNGQCVLTRLWSLGLSSSNHQISRSEGTKERGGRGSANHQGAKYSVPVFIRISFFAFLTAELCWGPSLCHGGGKITVYAMKAFLQLSWVWRGDVIARKQNFPRIINIKERLGGPGGGLLLFIMNATILLLAATR